MTEENPEKIKLLIEIVKNGGIPLIMLLFGFYLNVLREKKKNKRKKQNIIKDFFIDLKIIQPALKEQAKSFNAMAKSFRTIKYKVKWDFIINLSQIEEKFVEYNKYETYRALTYNKIVSTNNSDKILSLLESFFVSLKQTIKFVQDANVQQEKLKLFADELTKETWSPNFLTIRNYINDLKSNIVAKKIKIKDRRYYKELINIQDNYLQARNNDPQYGHTILFTFEHFIKPMLIFLKKYHMVTDLANIRTAAFNCKNAFEQYISYNYDLAEKFEMYANHFNNTAHYGKEIIKLIENNKMRKIQQKI